VFFDPGKARLVGKMWLAYRDQGAANRNGEAAPAGEA
jgi:hypothetical protein